MSNLTNGGLLLPNIPVNKDHRTLLDTLAELACEKGGMHPNSLEDSSMTTVEGASPRRMVTHYFVFSQLTDQVTKSPPSIHSFTRYIDRPMVSVLVQCPSPGPWTIRTDTQMAATTLVHQE